MLVGKNIRVLGKLGEGRDFEGLERLASNEGKSETLVTNEDLA